MNANQRLQHDEKLLHKVQKDIHQIRNRKKHSRHYIILCYVDTLTSTKYKYHVVHCNYSSTSNYEVSDGLSAQNVLDEPNCHFDHDTACELIRALDNGQDNLCFHWENCFCMCTLDQFNEMFYGRDVSD